MPGGVAFVILIIGLFHLFAPRAAWWMSIGWKLRDGEPSDLYIGMSRFGGGLASVVAIIILIVSIAHG